MKVRLWLTTVAMTVATAIAGAQTYQIDGAPSWTSTTRYDIVAKAEGEAPPAAATSGVAPEMVMLRSLLVERFKLAVHFATREMPVYELKVARDDGKVGPNPSRSTIDS